MRIGTTAQLSVGVSKIAWLPYHMTCSSMSLMSKRHRITRHGIWNMGPVALAEYCHDAISLQGNVKYVKMGYLLNVVSTMRYSLELYLEAEPRCFKEVRSRTRGIASVAGSWTSEIKLFLNFINVSQYLWKTTIVINFQKIVHNKYRHLTKTTFHILLFALWITKWYRKIIMKVS